MLSDLLVVRHAPYLHEVKLDGIIDETGDPEAIVGEVALVVVSILLCFRVFAVVPQVGGEGMLSLWLTRFLMPRVPRFGP